MILFDVIIDHQPSANSLRKLPPKVTQSTSFLGLNYSYHVANEFSKVDINSTAHNIKAARMISSRFVRASLTTGKSKRCASRLRERGSHLVIIIMLFAACCGRWERCNQARAKATLNYYHFFSIYCATTGGRIDYFIQHDLPCSILLWCYQLGSLVA
jgi:hypothetical protein